MFLKECASVRTCFTITAVHAQCTVHSVRVSYSSEYTAICTCFTLSALTSHSVLQFAACFTEGTAVCKGPTLTVLQSAFVSH